ncbi:RAP1-interacting factor 1 [Fonsecaea pedrosoi]|nr:RAP1-interacting factor 1 [Fonsecaea pedrosoi]
MSVPDVLPLSPPSTSSRRKVFFPRPSAKPMSTPDSPASFPGSSNTATRKRVGFSIGSHVDHPSSTSQPPASTTRPSHLPSSGSQPSLKSILKPSSVDEQTAQAVEESQDAKRTMGEMIESILQQLSHDDRSLSVDAYQTLASVIREYDDIPEEEVLKAKITTILKYIKRDLQKQPSPNEPLIADTNLVTQALKVLVIFVWNRDYSSLLTDEHRIFVLDRSIQVISEHTAPKGVILHYLHLLATQNFRPVLVNNTRVTRLLEALRALTEHVKGNGVVSERLLVYQKLLDQARPTMKARANLWVEALLTGMTNSLKDVRTKAIAMGLKACSVFPVSYSISVTVKSILAAELSPGKTFSSAMCRRLEKMITVREEGIQVPQIWTIVLMLSNGVEERDSNGAGPRFDKWPQFMDWLKVIQTCFNCSESAIKQQAYMAWDRFIHIIRPHQTSDTLMALLAKPLTAQMERQSTEQASKGTRPTAVSSYCTLLYYAFRPAATHKQYTRVWNEYIVKVMKSSFFEKSSANADIASRIFMALFWNSKKSMKVWNEKRALENTRVEPEELPTIDCKWIRAKSRAILDMFQVLMQYSSWGASGNSDKAFIAIAWSHFLKALREASSKEIKPSPETLDAMTNVTNFLGLLFEDCSGLVTEERASGIHGLSLAQVRHLTLAAITELGTDLIKAGLELNCDVKRMLVIYDTLESVMRESKNEEDSQSRAPSEALKTEAQPFLRHSEELLEYLNTRLLRDFGTQHATGKKSLIMLAIEQLEQNFDAAPQEYIVRLLGLLQPTLSTLLKDDEFGKDETRGGSYSEIVRSTLSILARTAPGTDEVFDDVLAAFFESPHIFARDEAITLWNMRYSHLRAVSISQRLSEALCKLREAGIELIPDTTIPPAPAGGKTPTSTHKALSPDKVAHSVGPSPELGSQHFELVTTEHPSPTFSGPRRQSPRSRARFDDSQVLFVPIDSSPACEYDSDSQCLTEHQKEVRDRQRSEPTVVFADLRSSPRPHSRATSVSNCGIARKAAALPERPSTPTLPTGHDQQEPEIPASPTPRARHIANQIADIDVPSSPPSIPGSRDRGEITSSPPQSGAEDGQVRIDLAIAPPQVVCQQSAMKANDVSPTEDVTGPFSTVNEQRLVNAQTNINMLDQSTEEAVRAVPTTTNPLATTTGANNDRASSSPMATRNDSDEIDMLSASQLSHDLDQHLSQVVEDEGLQIAGEGQEPNGQAKHQTRRSRKRKSSSLRFTSNKRRRSQISSQTSSQATNSSLYETPGEMEDCIEIVPSRAVQAIATNELVHETRTAVTEPTSAPKRRRGRQRRRPENVSSTPESPIHHLDAVEVVVPGTRQPKEGSVLESDPLPSAPSKGENAAAENPQLPSSTNEVAASIDLSACPDEPAEGGTQPSLSVMLQNVLDRLKSSEPGDVDLRAVDELCFQIRFQAQVITQRQDDKL